MQGYTPWMQAAPGPGLLIDPPAIIFDFDGTLADSLPLTLAELTATFHELGLPLPPRALLQKCNGPSHEEVAVLLGMPAHRREDFCRIWEEQALLLLPNYQRPFPGVLKMLDALSSCARLCIASNGKPEYLQASLELMGIKKYFHEVKGGAPGRTKGQSVKELLSDSLSRRVMMAGDRMADILAGRENGLYTVAACYGYGSPEEWADADWKAQTVEELTDICLAFCQR